MNNLNTIDRRRFLESTGLMAAGLWLMPQLVFSQEESPVITIKKAAATAKINITKLRGNVSMLEGSGGNIAVFNGAQGKLMVDAGIGVSKPNVMAALQSISSNPLKYLINTHWHFDHADGNLWVHEAGATIIAQENTRKHLSSTVRVDDWDYTFPPAPIDALPTTTFKNKHSLQFNGETIEMKYYKPSHTDSDISVYFTDADVLHVADTFWNGYYPFIDYNTGGNITGMIKAAEYNVQRTTNKTIVIPGHGPVGNKQHLIEFRDMLVSIHSKVAALKKQGKTLKEIIALKPTASFDSKWGGFVINGDIFTMLVYKGL
ncbi:MAG: MBL fold metallo-hydrolase [Flavobacterium sp.]|nr:MBL fold metallo-hydrolase [Flavobacterium sp.]